MPFPEFQEPTVLSPQFIPKEKSTTELERIVKRIQWQRKENERIMRQIRQDQLMRETQIAMENLALAVTAPLRQFSAELRAMPTPSRPWWHIW